MNENKWNSSQNEKLITQRILIKPKKEEENQKTFTKKI
jgi:hypothetical protein